MHSLLDMKRFSNMMLGLAGMGFLAAGLPVKAGLEGMVTEFSADRRSVGAAYGVPWSEAAIAREVALLKDWQGRVEAVNYETLDLSGQVDWHLLRTHLAGEVEELGLESRWLAEMEPLLSWRRPLQELMAVRERREEVDPQAAAGVLARALEDVKALRKRLGEGREKEAKPDTLKVSAVLASRTAGAMEALQESVKDWFQFYEGFQPDFSWWVKQPQEALGKGLQETAEFLKKEIAGLKGGVDDPLIGDPIGAEALEARLKQEMIAYSAEELLAVAEREFTWCEGELQKAALAMNCQDGKAALAKVKSVYAPPGGQAVAAVKAAEGAIRFLDEKELITIPPLARETWRMGMIGMEQQKNLPYAVYSDPQMLVAYAHEGMSHEDKLMSMRGNNAAFLHIVTPHELIPGHHLQGFMAKRYAAHRQLFRTPFLVEGWALHWEMLLWDLGYVATPEQKVGALFWRMHRCARILVSLKFHLGQMTPAQMVDFLVERVGHERSGATAEVRRYIGPSYGPLYQAAYMLGGLQLRSLYQDLTGPGKKSPKAFHDAVLREGSIPLEMIRLLLKGGKVPRDWEPVWRF